MSTNYPKGSLGEQENKNATLAKIIIVIGYVALHAAAYFLSKNKLGVLDATPALWVVPVVSLLFAAFVVVKIGSDYFEENKWPYIVGIILLVASLYCVGACPSC